MKKDPTNIYQKSIQKVIKESNLFINKRQTQHLIQKKPSAPNLKAQLKLHKTNNPIRPVINNRTAPAYKLTKHLTKIPQQQISLNNQYNTNSSANLANTLKDIPVQDNHKMITFDIKDLYVNIPIDETINIIKTKLQQNNNRQVTYQIIAMIKTVLQQNYFAFQQTIYQPREGISMGSPISGIIAEIFLQNYEDNHIKQNLDTKSILYYTRYVDIFIIYDETKTNPQTINTQINKIHNNMKFTPTHEEHNTINYLDLTIRRHDNRLTIDIYRKPTATDTTINFLSNHPIEQQMATFRSYLNRMHALPLSQEGKQKEWKTIQTIAKTITFLNT